MCGCTKYRLEKGTYACKFICYVQDQMQVVLYLKSKEDLMIPEQREALDEIIVKIRAGRMTRRTFLERAMTIGLSTSAAVSLLEACGGTSNSPNGNGQATNIVWQSENDTSGTYPGLVDTYNKTNKDNVHVTWHNGPSGTGDILTIYDNTLRARSGSIHVMSIDVRYPSEFASNGRTVPVDHP